MANDKNQGPSAAEIAKRTEGWFEDDRSLPMYNTTDCPVQPIIGYLVGVDVLGGSDDPEKAGKKKKFRGYIVKLTAPCQAKVNDEVKTIPAGKEIYIHGADLRDLDRVCLDPVNVFEYCLTPDKKIKMDNGGYMQTWKRRRNPTTFKRAEVCPNRVQALPTPAQITHLLSASNEDPSFDPNELEAERVVK